MKKPSLQIFAAVLACMVLGSSCFTPRGSREEAPLEGALNAGAPIPFEPMVTTIGFGSVPAVAPEDKEAYDLARRYLVAMGADLTFDSTIEDMMNVFRRELPKVPPEFFQEFKAKLDVSKATDQVIRATMKLHSKEDLRAIVAFFDSSAGKAFLARRPDFTQDIARLGVEFGRQINERLVLELKRRSFMY